MSKQMSESFIIMLIRHMEIVSSRCVCQPMDTRGRNALRLIRKDINRLKRMVEKQEQQ